MSAPQSFPDLPAAIEAFAAGRCKRWVRVAGHQIDLLQAQAEASRVREEPAAIKPAPLYDRALVAKNIAAELARASEVLPELAVPEVPAATPVECCRACGRPMIGAVP